MGSAPSPASIAALDQILSRAKPKTSLKNAAAFSLAIALAIAGPIAVYTAIKDPPMTGSELVILRALVEYTAEKTGQAEDAVWSELHLHGALDRASFSTTKDQWSGAVRYLVARIGMD
jgi:hypothetical protein